MFLGKVIITFLLGLLALVMVLGGIMAAGALLGVLLDLGSSGVAWIRQRRNAREQIS
jgi:hypothetical protein